MLAGTRIALTELRKDDAEPLFGWINDPHTVRFNSPYAPVHELSHLAWLERIISDPSRMVFGIREIQGNQLVGVVQLIDIHPVHRSAELVIRIGSESDRSRGYGTEAVQLAKDFAFRDRNLQRISLKVFADNARAVRAYKKAGFQQEGVLRRAAFINGRWSDEIVMAALADS